MTAPMIAILDNAPSFLSLMHDLLAHEGFRTLRCRPRDVLDVRALLRYIRCDLVILDLSPEKREDGWKLLTRLWDDAETAHIPAIIITGEPGLPPVRAGMLHTRHRQVVAKLSDRAALLAAIEAVGGFSRTVSDGRGVAHESYASRIGPGDDAHSITNETIGEQRWRG